MTNTSLAESYLAKAKVRLEVLDVYLDKEAYSDVVREAQEVVELALKGMLRQVGMEPPHWHDVGYTVYAQHAPTLPQDMQMVEVLNTVARLSQINSESSLSETRYDLSDGAHEHAVPVRPND